MADQRDSSVRLQGEAALPRAQVLGYLALSATPTRVRAVTASALLIVGYLTLVAALFLAALWVIAYPRLLSGILRRLHWQRGIVYFFRYSAPQLYVPIVIFPALLVAAGILVASAKYVRRGRKVACVFALTAMGVVTLIVAVAAATIGAFGIFMGTGAWATETDPPVDHWQLWWLLATLLLVPVVALLLDVCNYLLWIFKNPVDEKPSTPFLPTRR